MTAIVITSIALFVITPALIAWQGAMMEPW
jgi:hypothetical protein